MSQVAPTFRAVALAAALLAGPLPFAGTPSVLAQAKPAQAASRAGRPILRIDGLLISRDRATESIQRAMKAQSIPGLGVAIFNRDEIIFLKSFGVGDTARRLAMTDSTPMPAGAFGETMLSFLVMQMVDDKAIDLDKPVYTYLSTAIASYEPYRQLADDERFKKITARMLLNHTSGISQGDSILRISTEPGVHYAHSSQAINLMGLVVEQIAKKPLDSVMTERIFRRYAMRRTMMRPWAANTDLAVSTSIRDMATFFQAVLGGRVLSVKTRTDMLRPTKRIEPTANAPQTIVARDKSTRLSSGMGWLVFMTPYGPAFAKNASSSGWSHFAMAFDDAKTGIVLMSNSKNGDRAFKTLAAELIGDDYSPVRVE